MPLTYVPSTKIQYDDDKVIIRAEPGHNAASLIRDGLYFANTLEVNPGEKPVHITGIGLGKARGDIVIEPGITTIDEINEKLGTQYQEKAPRTIWAMTCKSVDALIAAAVTTAKETQTNVLIRNIQAQGCPIRIEVEPGMSEKEVREANDIVEDIQQLDRPLPERIWGEGLGKRLAPKLGRQV